MIGLKQERNNRFKHYLRWCCVCGELFKAFAHHNKRPKTKLCPECKVIVNKNRLAKIMVTKNRLKEIREHELTESNL